MDLIYTNADREDVGVLLDYDFDLAFGSGENDFELTIGTNQHCCQAGCLVYMEGTEYGGIVDGMEIDTKNDSITYKGRTWHGILASKVIEPLKVSDEGSGGVVVHKGGKNLISYPYYHTTRTTNGIVWTDNGDGSITANGTATANSYFYLTPTYAGKYMVLEANTYTFFGNGTSSNLYIGIDRRKISDGTYVNRYVANTNTAGTFNITEEDVGVYYPMLLLCVPNGLTVENETFYPQLEVGDTATSYKPYESMVDKYLMLSGEANNCIQWLIDRSGLSDLFTVSTEYSGLEISNFKMNRYVDGYKGIVKMLGSVDGKLHFEFKGGMVVVSAIPSVDYSKDEQFDNDQTEMKIKRTYNRVNHLICLGSGELEERQVVHLYVDSEGNISTTQSITGLDEVTDVYNYSNVESLDELIEGGMDKLKELASADSVDMDFNAESSVYDIGDIVGAKEIITGISVTEKITKKIVTINKGQINIKYKVGE